MNVEDNERDLRAEAELRDAIRHWEPPSSEPDDAAMVQSVVDRYLAERSETEAKRRRPARTIAALGLGFAAALALMFVWPDMGQRAPATAEPAPMARRHREPGGAEHKTTAGKTPVQAMKLQVTSGRLLTPEQDEVRQLALSQRRELHAGAEGGCLAIEDASLCLDPAGRLAVEPGTSAPRIELMDGRGELTVPRRTRVSTFFVQVAGDRFEAGAGTRFVIETSESSTWELHVVEGRVMVHAEGGLRAVSAGERMSAGTDGGTTGPDTSRPAKPRPAELLEQARSLRAQRELAKAANAYEKLVETYPRSNAAMAAQLALGQLERSRGRPGRALQWFDRYLAGGGELGEEAAYGRIRALRALGREHEAREAIATFLDRYPGSSYAAGLRQSLQ